MSAKLEPRGEPLTKTLGNVRTWRGILRSQSGQSLVELAFLTPVLLLLLIGTVEMGRYTSLSIMIGNSARAGAQYGAQNTTTAGDKGGIQSAALADLKDISGLKLAPQVTSTFVCGCDNGGQLSPLQKRKTLAKQPAISAAIWLPRCRLQSAELLSRCSIIPGFPRRSS